MTARRFLTNPAVGLYLVGVAISLSDFGPVGSWVAGFLTGIATWIWVTNYDR
jgi:hypothetical protein